MYAPSLFGGTSRIGRPRTVRAATQRRLIRKSRARYTGIARVSTVLGSVLFLLMTYVVLTSSLTGLSYALAQAKAQREALQEETMRLDDRIAALRSDDRLATLAARIGMREPQQFAIVRIESPRIARVAPHFHWLSSLAGLLAPALTPGQ